MEVTFGYTTEFKRQIKRLRKKYASLQSDFDELLAELSENPFAGVDLGDGVRKVRMAIKSKGKGKSGGARVTLGVGLSALAVLNSSNSR